VWSSNEKSGKNSGEIFPERQRQLLRAVVGTMAAACAITILCGFSFPRYSYSWLPLICLAEGAVAEAWIRGIYPRKITDWLHVGLAAAGITFAVGTIVLVVLCLRAHSGNAIVLFASASLGLILSVSIVRWILQNHQPRAVGGLVAMILLAGPLYGMREGADREHRSAAKFAAIVRGKVSAGETVTTGHLVLDQPEIFYYAGVNVESYPLSIFIPREYPTSRWMLLESAEYDVWRQKMPGRLTDLQFMQNPGVSAVLGWYEAKNDQSASASNR
jgi:hypothetical protein